MVGAADRHTQAGTSARARKTTLAYSFAYRLLLFLVALCLIAGTAFCIPAPTQASTPIECQSALSSPTDVTSIHVQPDAGRTPILDEIFGARCSIDLNMYLFTDDQILAALEQATARGISVRVILERNPYGMFGDQQEMYDRLIEIGAQVRWAGESFNFSHAKYMIVDNQVLIVTNQNFTNAGFESNREFGVITTSPPKVAEAVAVFGADWTGYPLATIPNHLVVSPENSRTIVLNLINGSTKTLWMYSEVLRDEDVTAALDAAAGRGVDVRLLVNPSADEGDVPYFLDAMSHGVQIRVLNRPYVHSKVMIVDGVQVLVGSQNYSYTSLNLNRELGIIVVDPINVELVVSVYEQDWSRAEPVDTIAIARHSLTLSAQIGRILSGRWGVV